MKKVLLFAILALSINAFAQTKHPISNSKKDIQGWMKGGGLRMEDRGWKTSDNYSEMNLRQVIKHQTPEQRELIQIFDSIYYWQWDTLSNGWKIDSKTIKIVYDANNNRISKIVQKWNGSAWNNYAQYTYTFDANNIQTSTLYQTWNSSAWVNSWRHIFTYNANNYLISELDQEWSGSDWVNSYQCIYGYDENYNWTSEVDLNWNGTAWVNDWQYIYTYDAKNNLINEYWQSWNGSAWVNYVQFIPNYDINNIRTSELIQNWNGSAWEDNTLYIYTYDANNNLICGLGKYWNGSTWVDFYRYIYTYDSNNNPTIISGQEWNDSIWIIIWQYLYTYDVNNLLKNFSHKYWNDAGTKVTSGDSTYYYFHTVLGINDLMVQRRGITVYPNPSSEKITIESPTIGYLSILNVNGQQLLQKEITEPITTVDISNLPSGVYFVRATIDKAVQVKKIIKQ
jgi:hypothetical protein